MARTHEHSGASWYQVLKKEHAERCSGPIPRKVRLFFGHLTDPDIAMALGAAATKAGYKHGSKSAQDIKRKYPKTLRAVEDAWQESLVFSPSQVHEALCDIASDPNHKDRFRALELISKIHGMTSEKLSITMSRTDLLKAIDDELDAIAAATHKDLLRSQ